MRFLARTAIMAVLMGLLTGCTFDKAPMDLRTVARAAAPHDGLACPPGACSARADIDSPVFDVDRKGLLEKAREVIAEEPRTELVARDAALDELVFVQRSRLFGFPDTIWVQAVDSGSGASVIVYSRSNYGYWDLGVNEARVRDWVAALQAAINRPVE